ncbi:MAG TPA: PSD1 and planctomycete cytochrome C domain-containing protein, partial [Verrucomicrobiae bacterium]|nr:PSD1 and planctomycete cytochrome C domain-containing protein [Verrucomicrobiae bacterium]
MKVFFSKFWTIAFVVGMVAPLRAAIEPEKLEFFESKIRPILVDNCYECHSLQTRKSKGGLTLDTREGLLKGGDTGPAIVAGDPEKSLLIKAVRYTDEELKMPPKNKKLSDEKISYLVEWIKMGAPDPRAPVAAVSSWDGIYKKASQHWAFQAVKKPELPMVKNGRWAQTPVDAFILAKLEAKKMRPSAKADKRTLIRRASFGLTGLPPTPEEVRAFEADDSPEAWEHVIDRYLASPRYGERWARHWLDVSRYADTKGYVFQEERRYPYAYTYRDYVIRAFNADVPYDRFIIEQLAADFLELGDDKRPLAAMGFLTLGRRFLNQEPDIIDDRIDTAMRGLQGLTVACARCHDHKFDPIPTKDYYSLYGVLASSIEPAEKPLLGNDSLPPLYPEYKAEREKRTNERANFVRENEEKTLDLLREKAGDYLLAAHDGKKLDNDSKIEALAKERKLDFGVVRRWMNKLDFWKGATNDPIWKPWFAFAALDEKSFAEKAPQLAAGFEKNESSEPVNPRVAKILAGEAPKDMKEIAKRYGELFAAINKEWKEQKGAEKFADNNDEAVRQVLFAPDAPANLPRGEIPRLWEVKVAEESRRLQRKIEELEATHPGAPPRAMALKDRDTPRNPRVFVRGNASNPGPEVPRQFLEIIAGPQRKPFEKGSGRLEMAQAIASKENPLTARVFVNRVWLQHFGTALVRTPSDFGLRSEAPVQRELLDYLAWRFMEEGWSIKKLHKLIMLSSVYQQKSDIDEETARLDPMNDLYSHMNRRRLELEPMRDTLLAVSGGIDLKIGGHPQDILAQPFKPVRTIYGFIDRQNLPGMFRTFDLATPDSTSPQRFNTTVPQQALFMMNGPFVIEQSRRILERPEVKAAKSNEKKIEQLYEIALQRVPDRDEFKLAAKFIEQQAAAPPQIDLVPAWTYGYGELDTNSGKLASFKALPAFENNTWQGGKKLPDEKLDFTSLTETGGHPGEKMAVVRRWTAPRDGEI